MDMLCIGIYICYYCMSMGMAFICMAALCDGIYICYCIIGIAFICCCMGAPLLYMLLEGACCICCCGIFIMEACMFIAL